MANRHFEQTFYSVVKKRKRTVSKCTYRTLKSYLIHSHKTRTTENIVRLLLAYNLYEKADKVTLLTLYYVQIHFVATNGKP